MCLGFSEGDVLVSVGSTKVGQTFLRFMNILNFEGKVFIDLSPSYGYSLSHQT